MAELMLIPTPLAEGVLKTLYIDLASALNVPVVFGYDEKIKVTYAQLNVEPEILGYALVNVIEKYKDHINEVLSLPLVPLTMRGRGSDAEVMRRKLGFRTASKKALYSNLISIIRQNIKHIGEELLTSNLTINIVGGKYLIKANGDIPSPSIIENEVFYELGRFSGFKDLTPRGPPKTGKASITLSAPIYALILLAILAYEVTADDSYILFLTIDYPLSIEIPYRLAQVLIRQREELTYYIKELNIGTYTEDFDSLRLALLYRIYHNVKKRHGVVKYLDKASYIFHVIMGGGKRFIKTLEYIIDLSAIDVLDNGFKTLGIKGYDALRLSRTLSDVLMALIRASSIIRPTSPIIEKVKIHLRNLMLGILDANIPPVLESAYIVSRSLEEKELGSITCRHLQHVVDTNIRFESAIEKRNIEDILADLMKEEDVRAKDKEEFTKIITIKRLNELKKVLRVISK